MNKYLKAAIGVVCIILMISVVILLKPSNPLSVALAADISLKPTVSDNTGVDTESAFVFASAEELEPKTIENNLSIEPEIDFSVQKSAHKAEVIILPTKPLEPNRLYRFSLNSNEGSKYRWAFQTKGEFRIVSTLPGDKSGGVPLDTGIELSFSHLGVEALKDYFEITPKVEGRFEVHKKTVVFVPKALEPATLYTVKVSKGLSVAGSDSELGEDYCFQFETREDADSPKSQTFYLHKDRYEFTTDDIPVIALSYFSREAPNPTVNVTVFKYKSAEEYIGALQAKDRIPDWAYSSRSCYQEDTTNLNRVAVFDTQMTGEFETCLPFPQRLDCGFYLAELSLNGAKSQAWFQVTNLGAYLAEMQDKTLIWVNDLLKGTPAQGAKAFCQNTQRTSVTDKHGVAILPSTKEPAESIYLIISKDNQKAVVSAHSGYYHYLEEGDANTAQQYWKYLYLDRGLYKPDDTIQFWGLIKPRRASLPSPDKVTVELTKAGFWEQATDITSVDVAVKDGIFTGSLELPNLTPGYYSLLLKDKGITIASSSFEVQTYTKPTYQLEITPSQKALFAGEKVQCSVLASFFEGTGAANMKLSYHIADSSGEAVTDSEGKATIDYTPRYKKDCFPPIGYHHIYLQANTPESGEIYTAETLVVLNNDIIIEGSGQVEDSMGYVDVNLSSLTTKKYNREEANMWDRDVFKGEPVVNHKVTASIYRDVWDKHDAGEYYDFVNKRVEKRYTYTYRKEFVAEDEVFTDASGQGRLEFAAVKDQSYRVELRAEDFRGKTAYHEVYVRGPHFYREYDYQWYHLQSDKEPDSNKYDIGEEVNLSFMNNEVPLKARENGYLFLDTREGLLGYKVQDTPTYKGSFSEELIPNYCVEGVFFDGRCYHEASGALIAYDWDTKALAIQVSTDKKEYKPGEQVKLKVEVKDIKGKPVEATVNLNVVDEALYALRDQSVNLLSSLYGDYIPAGIRKTALTHEMPNQDSGAEGGGEGPSERKDLRDAVFFKTLTTDKSGKANASFTLPDNLTSWRLTYQAVTKSLQAGNASTGIIVKLPFFIELVANTEYLAGDKPVVTAKAFGENLQAHNMVDYSLQLKKGDQLIHSDQQSGAAFRQVNLALPKLTKGNYHLSITGKSDNGLSDMLTISFAVKDSFRQQQITEFFTLEETTGITALPHTLDNALDSPVKLVFADSERSQYLNALLNLSNVKGSRIDQKLAEAIASEMLQDYFPQAASPLEQNQADLFTYQTAEGGLALLPYADAELELSAKVAGLTGANKADYDSNLLAEYFYRITTDPKETRERGIIALYGLAALGEPVLQEAKLILQDTDLSHKERCYLMLALIVLGDNQPARTMLQDFLDESAQEIGAMLRINAGDDQDDILEVTSLAAIAAASLDLDEKNRLQQYVMENHTTDILTYLEQLLYLEATLPNMEDNPVSFKYSIGEKQEQANLGFNETLTLMLLPRELSKLRLSNVQGSIGVTAVYLAGGADSSASGVDGVKLTRTYGNEFKANNLIKVSITYEVGDKAPDGVYLITDHLPAGLKIVQRPYTWGIDDIKAGYPIEVAGQRIVFAAYGKTKQTFNYYARVVNSGEFLAEPAYIQHLKSGMVFHNTPKDRVSIP